MTTKQPVPMFESTIHDLDENEEIAFVKGFCPKPAGSLVRTVVDGRVREYRVVRCRLQVGTDATLIVDCRSEGS